MKMSVQIPFNQLLTAVKTLSSAQQRRLLRELKKPEQDDKAALMELLLTGPVATKKEIKAIENITKRK